MKKNPKADPSLSDLPMIARLQRDQERAGRDPKEGRDPKSEDRSKIWSSILRDGAREAVGDGTPLIPFGQSFDDD
jgi:hypothetical protein